MDIQPQDNDNTFLISWVVANNYAKTLDKLTEYNQRWVLPYALPWTTMAETWGTIGLFDIEYAKLLARIRYSDPSNGEGVTPADEVLSLI